jgi:carboxypeptidase Taq
MREEITDLDAHVERGEFSPILTWLREKVHRHGRKYPPALLVQKATGKPLSAEAFIRYVKNKFGELYGLK